ncbi:hypothetical protein GCM10011507_25140 [Edaphobacter acidisoli]|uniref:SCP domain-containing protein n=1 Tax=Edaphobacter acidisoli TaxID=2040573 RepID=A0A916RY38_9BACT|nr:CAP domain-containing protein [Edaphobacter acidisoli]GGA72485.1 hypothetical protein GCM10011507_25140 [Edaphobacter acidisoli]
MYRLPILATILALMVPAAPAQQGATVAEQYLFSLTNQHRAEHHLPALAWDSALARAARNHAAVIAAHPGPAEHQYLGEADLKSRTYAAGAHYSEVSENVAGHAMAPVEFDRAWMNSPVHRANILDPNLTSIGIAVVERGGNLFAVEDFSHATQVFGGTNQVEQQAERLLRERGLRIATSPEAHQDAREICRQPSSTAGHPLLIMQWDGADLTQLPAAVLQSLPQVREHSVAVGACPSTHPQPGFTTYHLAVLMF